MKLVHGGAYPVLVTPTQRRSFDATGHIRDTHEDYPEAMRWLAAKENVPLIDLNEMTRTLYEAFGNRNVETCFRTLSGRHLSGTDTKLLRITPTSIHTEPIK